MADGNLINPNAFDMFELDPSELAFQITFFAGFDDAPVKMKILADRVNSHSQREHDNEDNIYSEVPPQNKLSCFHREAPEYVLSGNDAH